MTFPRRPDDARRIGLLRALRLVEEPDEALDRICELARDLLSVPIVLISVMDETTQRLPNRCGLPVDHTSRDVAFCNYVIAEGRPMIVPDALEDERFRSNPLVTGAPFIRFYAGTPLALEDGFPLATLCCIDTKPRRFSEQQFATLSSLGSLALSQLRLRQANLSLVQSSYHDWLTGLANRRAFNEHLESTLGESAAIGRRSALLLVDLDGFKKINDVGGHDVGDLLLKVVSERLRTCVPASATVTARMGGDEFAVVVPHLAKDADAAALGAGIVDALRPPAQVGNSHCHCRASVGISVFPDHAHDPVSLLKAADLALYSAKDAGGDRFAMYTPELTTKMERLSSMLSRARRALLDEEVVPYYQPKISLFTGEVTGFEALLRLKAPNGLEPPSAIEAAFSDPSLSVELGRDMLRSVLGDMRQWRDADLPFGSVALNVTEFDLDADLCPRLLRHLENADLPASTLQIEVTENVFLGRQADAVARILGDLRRAGLQVSLDDFGTGYASLSHLREFPVDWLKLDRSFVSDMDADPRAASIVHGVVAIAQGLQIGVVAEGVETPRQLDLLRLRRCDMAQGYLFAKPMAASRVPNFLRTWQAWAVGSDTGVARLGRRRTHARS